MAQAIKTGAVSRNQAGLAGFWLLSRKPFSKDWVSLLLISLAPCLRSSA